MPYLAYAVGALRSFINGAEIVRTAGLLVRNVQHSTIETPMQSCHISSSTLRNRPARTRQISTFQPSQAPSIHAAFSPVEDPRQKNEPSSRIRIRESLREAAQTSKLPVLLRSRRDSTKSKGFSKLRTTPKTEAAFDQDRLKANVKDPEQSGGAISGRANDSIRHDQLGSSTFAGLARKARLQDHSPRTVEGSKGAMFPSRFQKASASYRSRTQNRKDLREPWQTQKSALSEKFGPTGWLPRKRLSPDTLEGIRVLHAQYPDRFTTPVLADQFKVSPEAIRRILKSKWRPNDEEEERRRQRWEKRGENIWSQMVEMGIKPPRKWRDMGVGKSRERMTARSEQQEPQSKSKSRVTTSLLGQTTTNLHTITENGYETGSQVPLADRIL